MDRVIVKAVPFHSATWNEGVFTLGMWQMGKWKGPSFFVVVVDIADHNVRGAEGSLLPGSYAPARLLEC